MSQKAKFIGVDVGTSSCKGLLLDERGKVLGQASASYPLLFTLQGIEQSPTRLWEEARAVIDRLLGKVGRKEEVKGIGITSQGITFIPVDEKGNPLAAAISWLDTRAGAEVEEILKVYSEEELFKLTGKRTEAYYLLPKLLWLKEKLPELYERTDKFLLVADFITRKLTGESATDHTLAGGTFLYDVVGNRWAEEVMERFEISPLKLPSLRWAGEVIGYVREEIGLNKGTAVVIAGQDQKCAAFAAGINQRRVTVSLGTASAISCLSEHPLLDPEMRIPLFPFLFPKMWILEGVVSTAGASYDWARRVLKARIKSIPPPQLIRSLPFFLPHLSGASSPLWRKELRGSFHNLSLSTTSEDMILAVLEGVAFEIRKNIEVMEELVGKGEEIVVFGGGGKNKIWQVILATILGKALLFLGVKEASALGAAILASKAAGYGEGFPLPAGETVEPNKGLEEIFGERFRIYKLLTP